MKCAWVSLINLKALASCRLSPWKLVWNHYVQPWGLGSIFRERCIYKSLLWRQWLANYSSDLKRCAQTSRSWQGPVLETELYFSLHWQTPASPLCEHGGKCWGFRKTRSVLPSKISKAEEEYVSKQWISWANNSALQVSLGSCAYTQLHGLWVLVFAYRFASSVKMSWVVMDAQAWVPL